MAQNRLLLALGVALLAACPFVISGWWHGGEWEMEALAAVISGALGLMAGLLWQDVRRGASVAVGLEGVAAGLLIGAAVLYALLGARLAVTGFGASRVPTWITAASFGAAVLAGAAASGRYRPGRWSPAIEAAAILVGAVALVHLVRQAAVVSLLVGFGPGAVARQVWFFPFTGLRPGQLGAGGLLIAAAPGIGFLIIRARRSMGSRAAFLVGDAMLAVALLSTSYRLAAALALAGLLFLDAASRHRRLRDGARLAAVVLSLLPVDVSLQHGAVPGPGWLSTAKGDFSSADAYLSGPRHGYIVMAPGSHQTLYYEPRWVWAW